MISRYFPAQVSGTRVAQGYSAVIDCDQQNSALVICKVTALTGTLDIAVEVSINGTDFVVHTDTAMAQFTTSGTKMATYKGLGRYVRIGWTPTTSATLVVDVATAEHQ